MVRKTSQKISIMPERLGKLIELVNGLPVNAEDRLKNIMRTAGIDELPVVTVDYEFNSDFLKLLIRDFAGYVGQLPIQVQDFIGHIHRRTIIKAMTRWILLINAKKVLEEIARRNAATGKPENDDDLLPPDAASLDAITENLKGKALEDTKRELKKYKDSFREAWMQDQKAERQWIHKTMLLMWQQGIEATTLLTLQLNSKGQIEMAPNLLIDALQGVEAYRIRKCAICDQFFYATRTDLIACPKPKKCAGILRTRRWRDRYGEVYYKQRVDRANEKEAANNPKSKKQ